MKIIPVCFFIAIFLFLPIFANAESTIEREARLQSELAAVEKLIKENEKILTQTQNQSASLKRDITILDTKIKAAQLNIKAKNLAIELLGKDINKKQQKIESLEERIGRGRETLSQIMRKTSEIDSYTLPEIILTNDSLSTFLSDIDNFESVQESMKETFEQIRDDKSQTESEKATLNKRKNQESDARAVIEAEKKNIEKDEKEKQRLLKLSQNDEKTYSQLLAERRAEAARIRAALFALRDTAAIRFDVALQFANEASRATGIRPAFLLAIFAQESSLDTADSTFGKQVGSCYLTDPKTGAGASVKSGNTFPNVMKPGRDVGPFLDITRALGLDYTKTLISCPQSVGWGGAMGPAQFIPSTWILFKDRITRALGISVANPWNPEHAFMAASMYLTDLGGIAGSYTAEKNAACRYYSGRACAPGDINNVYGTQVMAKADMIQRTMIDPLQGL